MKRLAADFAIRSSADRRLGSLLLISWSNWIDPIASASCDVIRLCGLRGSSLREEWDVHSDPAVGGAERDE